MNLTIRIPGRIDPDLSPNARIHYMARSRAVNAARRAAYFCTLDCAIQADDGVSIRYDVKIGMPRNGKKRDDDNAVAMLKAYVDGIADGLHLPDDHGMRIGRVEQIPDPEGVGYLEFRLTEIDDQEDAA